MDGQHRERLWRVIAERAEVGVARQRPSARGARGQRLLAARLAESQYTVGEGPGVEAFTTAGPVLVPDVSVEQGRWPGFVEAALAVGAGAAFAFPLQVGAIRLGTLELVRHRPGACPVVS